MPEKHEINAAQNMRFPIVGRVIEVWDYDTKDGKKFGHVVQTVSNIEDPHNMKRSRVIITSDRKISPVGVDVQCLVEMSGSVNDRTFTDPSTGQKKTFKDFKCYLHEVR